MSAIDRYVEDVMHRIAPGMPGRARFESDLRIHLDERIRSGEDETTAVTRMGAPEEVAGGFLEAAVPPLASPGERLGAFLFDVGLGAVALTAIGALAAWVLAPRVAMGPEGEGLPVSLEVGLVAAAILLFVSGILYFPVFETLFGQTAGKRLFGTVVAKDSGERMGLGPAIVRRLPLLFDIWPFDAAFLLFTARRQRAFDLAAKTIVFRTEGRHPRRPWLMVVLVCVLALALGLVAAAGMRID